MRNARSDTRPSNASVSSPPRPAPGSCPSCRSSSIVTTAKVPDEGTYWRCTACGDVWNEARRQTARYGARW